MKKTLTLSIIASSLLLTGCGDNTDIPTTLESVNYYVEHPSKTEDAMETCVQSMPLYSEKSQMLESIWKQYLLPETNGEQLESKFQSLANPEEIAEFRGKFLIFQQNCSNVNIAMDEIQHKKMKEEYKAKEEEKAKKIAKEREERKEEILSEYKDFNKNYKLDWPEKLEVLRNVMGNKDLRKAQEAIADGVTGKYILDEVILNYLQVPTDSRRFKAMQADWEKSKNKYFALTAFVNAYNEGLNSLNKKTYKEIDELKNKYCTQDERPFSACYVAKKAKEAILQNTEKELVNNYPKLKTTFNECVTKYNKEGNSMVFNHYPCQQAIFALETRGIKFNISEMLK